MLEQSQKKRLRFPYGVSDFYHLITNYSFYVDRTAYIPLLEDKGDVLMAQQPDNRERYSELIEGDGILKTIFRCGCAVIASWQLAMNGYCILNNPIGEGASIHDHKHPRPTRLAYPS